MFAEALLESSPSRASVLKKGHYFYATACGALASLACFVALEGWFSPPPLGPLAFNWLLFEELSAALALFLSFFSVTRDSWR